MNYNPQTFIYKEEDVPCFNVYTDVPIEEETFNGKLLLGYSKQRLVYGKVTVEPILGLFEYELIGCEKDGD
jgi:hypothetical protein